MSSGLEQRNVFKNYSYLPPELRMMVVNEMGSKDRCRFSTCSKICNLEAKASKDYVYSLKINAMHLYGIIIDIEVLHGFDNGRWHGYCLRFEKQQDGTKQMICSTLNSEMVWTIELEKSTNLVDYSSEKFKDLLKSCQHSIKELKIYSRFFGENFDFGIKRLRNLEELRVESRFLPQFLSKSQRALKVLEVFEEQKIDGCEKILRVQDRLYAPFAHFNYEQLLRISANDAHIHIGQVTEKELARFIKSWKHGKQLKWTLSNSEFDIEKFVKYMGAKKENTELYQIDLADPKRGILMYVENNLLMCLWKDKN